MRIYSNFPTEDDIQLFADHAIEVLQSSDGWFTIGDSVHDYINLDREAAAFVADELTRLLQVVP